ncbi:peptidyl-prolyl cis-trans isomerase [Rhizobiales bacterium]|uniref:peptidylprolyl isomerase n=1 Tax=Hongsoonwoonella zoysiae TaxID=2821844 RepID=UPI0015603261|nr:peptidylprolyl isomerase [Hongsoonwoonella zoysiae]NRG16086.1 peptidyl-prolyl cis-trans isomerase [Hongsoonwoonella zoysiae]
MPRTAIGRAARSVARDPLSHFLVLGFVLFGAYQILQPDLERVDPPTEIRFTVDDLAQLVIGFEAQWSRPPTQAEFNAVLEDRVRQDILYREALALGLDREDTIVKRRMAQKMQFLAEDLAAAREPTIDELKAWYADNTRLFEMSPRLSFRHIYFSPDSRGRKARDDAMAALATLAGAPQTLPEGTTLGDRFMFQDYYGERSLQEIAREFGPQFVQEVVQLPSGAWIGPVQSGLGWHLIYIDKVIPGRVPAFEEVASDVKTAWLGQQKAEAWQKAYDEMRAKYTVLLPVPETAAAGIGAAISGPALPEGDS